jgi:hypothetical protein
MNGRTNTGNIIGIGVSLPTAAIPLKRVPLPGQFHQTDYRGFDDYTVPKYRNIAGHLFYSC